MFRATRPLFQVAKLTTGLVGLPGRKPFWSSFVISTQTDRTQRPVNSEAIPQLRKLYADTLVATTTKLPAHSVYRQGVEATIQHRLKVLGTVKDDEISHLEQEIGAGQVEELVESAKDELQLIDMMAELKAYVSSSERRISPLVIPDLL